MHLHKRTCICTNSRASQQAGQKAEFCEQLRGKELLARWGFSLEGIGNFPLGLSGFKTLPGAGRPPPTVPWVGSPGCQRQGEGGEATSKGTDNTGMMLT